MSKVMKQRIGISGCRVRTAITVNAACLVAALLLTMPAVAAPIWEPTKSQVRLLHAEVDGLSDQFQKLESASSAEEQQRLVSEHWLAMTQHLRSVQQNVFPDCGPRMVSPTAVSTEAPDWKMPDIQVSLYQSTMRKRLGAMHDRMSRLDHEKSPFERQRLLRQYWTRVYDDMQRLREPRP